MNLTFKLTSIKLLLAAAFASQLASCVPVAVGGAVAGGAIASDRRTSGFYVEDQGIQIKANRKMESNLGEEAHVNVTSYNRNVLLTGEVPDAERLEVANVRSVTNELVVAPASSIGSRSNDTYITSKIKGKFVTENQFPANYVKVVTENGVVYLLGLVNQAEADAAVEIARNTDGVSKVVKLFEITQ